MDTEYLYFESCREALAEEGIVYTPEMYARYTLYDNRGARDFLVDEKGYDEKRAIQVHRRWLDRYLELSKTHTKLYPETKDVLESLKGKYKIGLVTGSKGVEMAVKFRTAPIQDFFDIIAVRESYQRSKPFPDPYLHAAQELGVKPEECLVIEDSPRGAQSAKSAGMTCFIIPNGLTKDLKFPEVDKRLKSLEELKTILL